MAVSKDKVRANLVINIELKKELEKIAKEEQRSFNNLVNKILSEYVKEINKED
ncbi:DNA-binding protein [uncultured Clostridium sp.]|uniref:DNA-binding protein n=1 Tax=uncultured Clostridium sp. TaxID=59620 RepID=UPI002596B33E|nr:DNA-binding protein [uncultured Clostridium sp.]